MEPVPYYYININFFHPVEIAMERVKTFIEKLTLPKEQFSFVLSYPMIKPFSESFKESGIRLCADSILAASPNCFTASISGKILKEAGAQQVMIGSRAERDLHKEKFSTEGKIASALESGLNPVLGFGENALELEEKQSKEVLEAQLHEALDTVSKEQFSRLFLLYEAPWLSSTTLDNALNMIEPACIQFNEILKNNFAESFGSFKIFYKLPACTPEMFLCLKPLSAAGYFLGPLEHLTPNCQF